MSEKKLPHDEQFAKIASALKAAGLRVYNHRGKELFVRLVPKARAKKQALRIFHTGTGIGFDIVWHIQPISYVLYQSTKVGDHTKITPTLISETFFQYCMYNSVKEVYRGVRSEIEQATAAADVQTLARLADNFLWSLKAIKVGYEAQIKSSGEHLFPEEHEGEIYFGVNEDAVWLEIKKESDLNFPRVTLLGDMLEVEIKNIARR